MYINFFITTVQTMITSSHASNVEFPTKHSPTLMYQQIFFILIADCLQNLNMPTLCTSRNVPSCQVSCVQVLWLVRFVSSTRRR